MACVTAGVNEREDHAPPSTNKQQHFGSVLEHLLKTLRYMQTLNAISAEKNSTIIFPLPIDLLSQYMKNGNNKSGKNRKSKKDLLSDDE
ncbi:Band 7 protein-like 3 [Homarus americanus]|uniref:Band 7 protein-like 3 n=1 Tax=Homarus americanus TaxID=6706 RepID=A0A8J5J7V9_HOMAM|nr:Band 7 protein-like 3 [Homarus americanus]